MTEPLTSFNPKNTPLTLEVGTSSTVRLNRTTDRHQKRQAREIKNGIKANVMEFLNKNKSFQHLQVFEKKGCPAYLSSSKASDFLTKIKAKIMVIIHKNKSNPYNKFLVN
jgi:hypothetical protein